MIGCGFPPGSSDLFLGDVKRWGRLGSLRFELVPVLGLTCMGGLACVCSYLFFFFFHQIFFEPFSFFLPFPFFIPEAAKVVNEVGWKFVFIPTLVCRAKSNPDGLNCTANEAVRRIDLLEGRENSLFINLVIARDFVWGTE